MLLCNARDVQCPHTHLQRVLCTPPFPRDRCQGALSSGARVPLIARSSRWCGHCSLRMPMNALGSEKAPRRSLCPIPTWAGELQHRPPAAPHGRGWGGCEAPSPSVQPGVNCSGTIPLAFECAIPVFVLLFQSYWLTLCKHLLRVVCVWASPHLWLVASIFSFN